MIRRALIQVTGPAWAGKTTLVEDLLHGLGALVICVRAERDDSLLAAMETAPRTHAELRRYSDAGACAVACYCFPASHADANSFFQTDFMQDYSEAVIIEGDCPLESVDLTVFVAPALPAGASLVVRARRDYAAEYLAALDSWEAALASPRELAQFLREGMNGPVLDALLADLSVLTQTSAKMRAELARLRTAPPPEPTEHWAVAPGYQGIEQAGLVVANARNEIEHDRCEALVREVARLRKDAEVFGDVIGLRGSRILITAVVAHLGTPRDPGVRKAVARVKRVIRNV